jgi:hypothetical protein
MEKKKMFDQLSMIKFEHIGNVDMPCIFCKKIISNPKFKKQFPPDYKETEFIPKPICVSCSDIHSKIDPYVSFETKYNDALNRIAGGYSCSKDNIALIKFHKKLKTNITNENVFNYTTPFLFITGASGAGKTLVAKALAETLGFRFIKAYDIVNLPKHELYHLHGRKLCIDDMGKELDKTNGKQVLYEIIDNRYDNRVPTIITTQFDVDALVKNYDSQMTDRLIQVSFFMPIPDNYDHRTNKTNWRKN